MTHSDECKKDLWMLSRSTMSVTRWQLYKQVYKWRHLPSTCLSPLSFIAGLTLKELLTTSSTRTNIYAYMELWAFKTRSGSESTKLLDALTRLCPQTTSPCLQNSRYQFPHPCGPDNRRFRLPHSLIINTHLTSPWDVCVVRPSVMSSLSLFVLLFFFLFSVRKYLYFFVHSHQHIHIIFRHHHHHHHTENTQILFHWPSNVFIYRM